MPNWQKLIKYKVVASEGETAREYYVWYNNKWKKYPGARSFSAYRNGKPPKDVIYLRNAAKKWKNSRPARVSRKAYRTLKRAYSQARRKKRSTQGY